SRQRATQAWLPLDAILVHLVVEVRSLDTDRLCGLADIPVELIEFAHDEDLLRFVPEVSKLVVALKESRNGIRTRRVRFDIPRHVVGPYAVVAEDEQPLYDIVQLAYVAAPLKALEP